MKIEFDLSDGSRTEVSALMPIPCPELVGFCMGVAKEHGIIGAVNATITADEPPEGAPYVVYSNPTQQFLGTDNEP